MRRYRAAWALPIAAPPIKNASVTLDRGRIVSIGPAPSNTSTASKDYVDLGSAVVLPGLVNAHTHLELSFLGGRIAPTESMPEWVDEVLSSKLGADIEKRNAIESSIVELRRHGTALVGDISNTLATVAPLKRAPLSAVVFHELLGFNSSDPDAQARSAVEATDLSSEVEGVRVSVAAHAPYSVSPALFEALRRELSSKCPMAPITVHLAESAEELVFLDDGGGPWRQLLERRGAWNPSWEPPRCSPVEFLKRVGWHDPSVIVVHGVHLSVEDLLGLSESGVTLVTCPRSNVWTGVGPPPINRFIESGVSLAVGTDSLASVPDLNLFAEIARLREISPEVPASSLLMSATIGGARALRWEDEFGTIEPGKSADLITVALPETVSDVEEYLVCGIGASDITWLEDVS
ncbi:MAG: amidohydrolase family protein [Vicinamibacterales bacterium]|nr:amidohydrolase family protein [Vicinamibacterales bacterium]HJO18290.1 amidohydrolase family protein [Vicinamibacterales bacterium]